MSQWACTHFEYEDLDLEEIYDLSFVGQPHTDRRDIVKKLKQAGLKVNVFGFGWHKMPWLKKQKRSLQKRLGKKITVQHDSGRVSQYDMIKIFNQTKINLNFTGNQTTNQIKGRNFEIPGTNSFMITEKTVHLEDYYQPDKEIVIYDNTDDLIDKIRYYLKHESERKQIAQNAYERTLADHTYEKRFLKLFNEMELIKL